MRCLSPVMLRNDTLALRLRYKTLFREVPCGKCEACIDNRRKEWFVRLKEECKSALNGFFVTLTYDEYHIPRNDQGFPTFCKRDIQLFMKSLRKQVAKKNFKLPVRYFLVPEYGSKHGRPHYHMLMFNVHPDIDLWKLIYKVWNRGRISVSEITDSRISYCANYMYGKSDLPDVSTIDDSNKLFILSSRRPGIGFGYLTDEMIRSHKETLRTYYQLGDLKYNLPRYYREKIFSETEKLTICAKMELRNRELLLQSLEEEAEHYQKYGHSKPSPKEERTRQFIERFRKRVKKHKSNNLNNEI